ncbi:hypothetical protein BpHYR1_000462 [Brachionus plicatilis]|uniref:Uncharacterized protein n=1 Tax=Brachionus plicatilis TaxID=10195 RepID=A0A3M7RN86_BRAPC|nr:hypothetical protein BpHYR1_000462 [Brachionus plicatilis]
MILELNEKLYVHQIVILNIRTTGYLMGVDYQGGSFTLAATTQTQVLKSDPYFSALSNFNAELSHTMSSH